MLSKLDGRAWRWLSPAAADGFEPVFSRSWGPDAPSRPGRAAGSCPRWESSKANLIWTRVCSHQYHQLVQAEHSVYPVKYRDTWYLCPLGNPDIATFLIVGAILLVVFWGVSHREKQRTKQFELVAAQMGLPFYPMGDSALMEKLSRFHLFSQGRSRKVRNLLRGVSGSLGSQRTPKLGSSAIGIRPAAANTLAPRGKVWSIFGHHS